MNLLTETELYKFVKFNEYSAKLFNRIYIINRYNQQENILQQIT